MLYRHAQTAFVAKDPTMESLRGPSLRVRPLDGDAPDHLIRFVLWGVLVASSSAPPPPPAVPDKRADDDRGRDGDVIVVTTPPPTSRAQMLFEMSADGESWRVEATLDPSDRPHLVTVPHMLRYVRVRLEPNGSDARGYAMVMANAPFQLQGPSPVVRPKGGVIVVEGRRR